LAAFVAAAGPIIIRSKIVLRSLFIISLVQWN
jgi:hypothetical protein